MGLTIALAYLSHAFLVVIRKRRTAVLCIKDISQKTKISNSFRQEIIKALEFEEAELKLKRYFIPCNSNFPTQACGLNTQDVLKGLSAQEYFQLTTDSAMTPCFDSSLITKPAVKFCTWSPDCFIYKSRSVLAILTNSGSVDLYQLLLNKFSPSVSISKLWLEKCSMEWNTDVSSESSKLLTEIQARTHKLKFTAIGWSKSFRESTYFLCTGTVDGTMSIWEVSMCQKTLKLQVTLYYSIKLNNQHITALDCSVIDEKKCIVHIAFIDGSIQSLTLTSLSNENNVILCKHNNLWTEKDKIQVPSGGLICLKNNENMFLYAVKGYVLLILKNNFDGELISSQILTVEETAITGLVPYIKDTFLITTLSGTFYIFKNQNEQTSISEFHTSFIKPNHYSCHGLALSKNCAFAAIATQLRCNFEHGKIKEPSHILWSSLYQINELEEIIKNHSGSIGEISDILESLRITSIETNHPITWNFSHEGLDQIEVNDLKKSLATLQLSLVQKISGEEDPLNKALMKEGLKDLILSCNVLKKISLYLNSENLTDLEKKRYVVMKSWLEYFINKYEKTYPVTTSNAKVLIQDQLSSMEYQFVEKCLFCEKELNGFTNSELAECADGHIANRCSLSLLVCGIPYYFCQNCNVIAREDAVTEINNCCIFCDDKLKFNDILLDVKEEISIISNES